MTSKRYTGNIITDTPTNPTGDAAKGVWSLAEAEAFKAANKWPTLPDAPTIGTASSVVTGQSASVLFTVPTNLYGGTVSQYTATSNPSGITGTATSSPVTVTGLTNGTSYTFTVTATTGAGTGAASSASNSVTPASGDVGIIAGGQSSSSTSTITNRIQYVNIASASNSSDWGDLTIGRSGLGSGSSSTRAVFAYGGDSSSGNLNTIDYISLTSTGNAIDFGDMSNTRDSTIGMSNSTYAVFADQYVMRYVTIASTGNSSDWGNMQELRSAGVSCASPTYGFFAQKNGFSNTIEYITFSSTGNSATWGSLTTSSSSGSGASSSTRGLAQLAYNSSYTALTQVDYFSLSSTGNASDFGDLTAARSSIKEGTSNATKAIFGGGYSDASSARVKNIDVFTIASTGNATDFGDLISNSSQHASTSNSHGGLS